MNIEEIKEWRKTAPAVPDYGELEIIDILLEEVKRLENQFAHKQEQRDQLAHQVLELEQQLARYQGGVEVEGVARSRGTSYAGMDCYVEVQLPMDYAGQQVRVLVMPKEVE